MPCAASGPLRSPPPGRFRPARAFPFLARIAKQQQDVHHSTTPLHRDDFEDGQGMRDDEDRERWRRCHGDMRFIGADTSHHGTERERDTRGSIQAHAHALPPHTHTRARSRHHHRRHRKKASEAAFEFRQSCLLSGWRARMRSRLVLYTHIYIVCCPLDTWQTELRRRGGVHRQRKTSGNASTKKGGQESPPSAASVFRYSAASKTRDSGRSASSGDPPPKPAPSSSESDRLHTAQSTSRDTYPCCTRPHDPETYHQLPDRRYMEAFIPFLAQQPSATQL